MNRFAIMAGMAMLTGMSAPSLMAQDMEEAPVEEKKEEVKGVAWTEDYEAALKEAAKTKKMIFVEVTATW